MWADGWERWLVPLCINVLAVKLIQISLIVSGCDMPLSCISVNEFLFDSLLKWAQITLGPSSECTHLQETGA